ncbi:bifunctional diguanylate cyclase/phosphodiesterase [Pseudomonas sp.]|uniref:putative bifunctional diguanylate cyclase/phosphodiesterase n=1 Tax=Pseudomonas sp. TaxID=306 RepID=UPI0028A6F80D|nr:bifunctional diguanylate cyclase/phosphodiesterase [Pseudomonas sp.]
MLDASQIDRELGKKTSAARFSEQLELRYQSDIHVTRRHHLILCLILGGFTFGSFSLWMVIINPEVLVTATLQMIGACVPSTLIGLVLLKRSSVRWREYASMLPSYTGFIGTYNVVINGEQPVSGEQSLFMFCWPLMLMYVNTCMKSPFNIALAYNIFFLSITAWGVHTSPITFSTGGLIMTAIGSSSFFSLLGNYWSNAEARRNYLYWLREETRVSSLTDANSDLQRLSETDSLTGLANRRHIQPQLDALTTNHLDGQSEGAVLLIDIDHFKGFNDHYGHLIGDECLKTVATALGSCFISPCAVARFGGEEFIAVLPDTSHDEARRIARHVLQTIRELNIAHLGRTDSTAIITVSIGLAHSASSELTDSSSLLDQADKALYRAKRAGRNRLEDTGFIFSQNDESLLTPEDIREALATDQFNLQFQPLYQLEPYKLTGYESLIRWQHPKLGNVPPDLFIAMAERSGLINAVGDWVLDKACEQANRWHDAVTVSVNISPIQLANIDFPMKVAGALLKRGLAGHRLILEITEGVPLRIDDQLLRTVSGLSNLGVRLALDDFGQGYANLAYLLKLPFHSLKVDRQVLRVEDKAQREQVLMALLKLGHAFGLKVLAEGVETAQDLELLRNIGYDHAQGYYLGYPQPVVVN